MKYPRDPNSVPNIGDGFSGAFSSDDVHWTKYEGNPVIEKSSDSRTLRGIGTGLPGPGGRLHFFTQVELA